jgi:cytoskeletal protein CcmA (bactofilin family)
MYKKNKDIKASNSILGKDSDFEGNIKFFGTLLIQGAFKGKIYGEGTVTIDEDATIRSDIHASEINIHGTIFGHVLAENKIHLYDSAKVYIQESSLQVLYFCFFQIQYYKQQQNPFLHNF